MMTEIVQCPICSRVPKFHRVYPFSCEGYNFDYSYYTCICGFDSRKYNKISPMSKIINKYCNNNIVIRK